MENEWSVGTQGMVKLSEVAGLEKLDYQGVSSLLFRMKGGRDIFGGSGSHTLRVDFADVSARDAEFDRIRALVNILPIPVPKEED